MKKNAARKNAYKMVDFICYNRDNIRKAVREARLDPHNERRGSNSGAYINDPTANKAMADLQPVPKIILEGRTIEKPELWLSIIDNVYAQFGDVERKIFDKRWTEKVKPVETIVDLYIERTTYYSLVHEIKSYIVEFGCQEGVLSVFKRGK